MIKKLHLKTMLLLCAMIMGIGSAWADSFEWDLTSNSYDANPSTSAVLWSSDFAIMTLEKAGSQTPANNFLGGTNEHTRVYKDQKITFSPVSGYSISSIVITSTTKSYASIFTSSTWSNAKCTSAESVATATVTNGSDDITCIIGAATRIKKIVVNYESDSDNRAETTIIISGNTTEANMGEAAATPIATVKNGDESITSATIKWGSSDTNVATIDESTGAITLKNAGTTTITATYEGDETYKPSTASYNLTVNNNPNAPGSESKPYTVDQAHNAIDAGTGVNSVYATGIVSEIVTAYSSEHGNITFNISADGSTTGNQLQAYRCKGAEGIDASEVRVGDVVVIYGNLTKYNSTYEFAANNELISVKHPTIPAVSATPNSLTDFTYEVSHGPSSANTFTVSGANLTEDLTVSMGASSNFEISLTEDGEYTTSLTLIPSEGTIETTIYVRLKAGLEVNTYTATITIASTEAGESSIDLSGSVTPQEAPNVTWDLSTDQTETATTTEMTWINDYASMTVNKAESNTNTNNYYPGTSGQSYTSTRFYKSSNLTITPASGYAVTSVVFTATTVNYANALQGSKWTNATAAVSGTTVTVTPTEGSTAISATIGGTCGFTSVKVYYAASVNITDAGYATYCSEHPLDFSGTGLTAYTASISNVSEVNFTEVSDVAANTGVLLKGDAGTYTIPFIASSTNTTSSLIGVTEQTTVNESGIFVLLNGDSGVGFYKTTANAFTVGAHTAYIPALPNSSRDFIAVDETTAIKAVESQQQDGEIYNLAGQRVEKAQKGLYIIGGKKVVIK